MAPLQIVEEVRRVGGHEIEGIGEATGNISAKDLEEVRSLLHQPPLVVQRTLEMTHLILNADRSTKNFMPPDWDKVQRTLSDAEFHTRVLSYDVEILRAAPGLCAYLVEEYLNPPSRAAGEIMVRRNSTARRGSHRRMSACCRKEPLTFERVRRANHAAASLFRWCVEVASHAPLANLTEGPPETPETPEPEPMPEPVPELALPEPAVPTLARMPSAVCDGPSPRSARPRKNVRHTQAVAAPQGPLFDRYFEVLVPFRSGRDLVSAEHCPDLRKVVNTMVMRRSLTLQIAALTRPYSSGESDSQRIYSIGLFLAAHGVAYTIEESEECISSDAETGVICRIRLDNDEELKHFFSGNKDDADLQTRNAARCLADNFRMR